MNNKKTEVALVVHACDRYQVLFQGFEYFFKKHWPETGRINFYFLTEEIDYPSRRFANVKTGKGEWSDRLRAGLQQLSEPFLIYMQEDMWLNKPVNGNVLDEILDFATTGNLPLVKLHSSEVYQTRPTGMVFGGLQVAKLDNQTSRYLMSHQASVWRRDFLLAQLLKGEHPWRNERKASKRLKRLDPPIYHIDLFAENGKPALNDNLSEGSRSEYQAVSVNGMLNANALPFIEELMRSPDRELSAYGHKLKHNFVNHVTHDGLPQPKKKNRLRRFFSIFRRPAGAAGR